MGTMVAIEAHAATAERAAAAVQAAFEAIAAVARHLHPQDADGDLMRIGRAPPGEPVPVWPGTFAVLRFAQRLNRASAGIFDPCLPGQPGRMTDVTLLGGAGPRVLARAPVQLDCGGIAKGFAVDRAIAALRRAGCPAGLVNAGGDVRAFGPAPATLLLRHAAGGFRPTALENAALAVSDRTARHPPQGHRGYYRRDGGRTDGERYAAVRAPACMHADALTKCVLLCPPALAATLLSAHHADRLA
jgi:FAD:protein FMN transferase